MCARIESRTPHTITAVFPIVPWPIPHLVDSLNILAVFSVCPMEVFQRLSSHKKCSIVRTSTMDTAPIHCQTCMNKKKSKNRRINPGACVLVELDRARTHTLTVSHADVRTTRTTHTSRATRTKGCFVSHSCVLNYFPRVNLMYFSSNDFLLSFCCGHCRHRAIASVARQRISSIARCVTSRQMEFTLQKLNISITSYVCVLSGSARYVLAARKEFPSLEVWV